LIMAGLVITGFGVSVVFVPQDVEYLRMLPEQVASVRQNMIPLIAHDRATFGGMLTSVGVALLLTTMWGYRRGSRWLWWLYLVSSVPAYGATLWIHQHIGYVNHFHLAPVYIGLLLLAVGLGLSRGWLLGGAKPMSKASL
jgi:dihydroorotate dehydrogenase